MPEEIAFIDFGKNKPQAIKANLPLFDVIVYTNMPARLKQLALLMFKFDPKHFCFKSLSLLLFLTNYVIFSKSL
jgi:hypothetical protein